MGLWQVKINLTQAPQPFYPNPFDENAILEWQEPENFRTFLYDPLISYPTRWYGLEIIAHRRLELNFICTAESEMEGLEIGHAWFSGLRFKFKGLHGTLSVNKFGDLGTQKYNDGILFEISHPRGLLKRRVNIIQKFANLFYNKSEEPIRMLLIWQRKEEESNI
ncbi:MAG: hypothetical protein EU535_07675, partial [Promethearchaeota archaeon]